MDTDLIAIQINENSLNLITLLNNGMTPRIEEHTTWFVFDAIWNSEVPNEIMTEETLLRVKIVNEVSVKEIRL